MEDGKGRQPQWQRWHLVAAATDGNGGWPFLLAAMDDMEGGNGDR